MIKMRQLLLLTWIFTAACGSDTKPITSASTGYKSVMQNALSNSGTQLTACRDYAANADVNMTASWDPSSKSLILIRPGDKIAATIKLTKSIIYIYSPGLVEDDRYAAVEVWYDQNNRRVASVGMNLDVNCSSGSQAFYDPTELAVFGTNFGNYSIIPAGCDFNLASGANITSIDFVAEKIKCSR
jgi:hypothetical protein